MLNQDVEAVLVGPRILHFGSFEVNQKLLLELDQLGLSKEFANVNACILARHNGHAQV